MTLAGGAFALNSLAFSAEKSPTSPLTENGQIRIEVEFDKPNGLLRPLHGVNKGPLVGGGLVDLTASLKALHIPWTRLHDCHFPNPDVVDMQAVFPRPEADPGLESSYDFARTDRYLEGIRATGSGIVYRLGQSIEHEPIKKWVHPPANAARWADACIGIIRHYNEGWANGFHFGIPYWEIWNEPENRPVMWTGNDEQFFALYRTASRAIKGKFPHLKIGGPAIGGTGSFTNGEFQESLFLKNFLDHCQRESLPLDFFSWHCYTDDPKEISARARAMRASLDARGFVRTESHLNEWNYLPDNSWSPLSRETPAAERERAYEKMAGPNGAAFIAAALMELQDSPVEIANLFHAETGAFGLFSEQGVPYGNYYGLLAFARLLETAHRVKIVVAESHGLSCAAGLNVDGKKASLLISSFGPAAKAIELSVKGLPWKGSDFEMQRYGSPEGPKTIERGSLIGGQIKLSVHAPGPSLTLITFLEKRD